MEAHPIPQNVTNFEFHLVGDMTLKQFGYLAAGVVFAYLVFVIAGTSYPFIAWPLILSSSLSGIAFAFLPIGERPLDHWLGAFLAAIFRPTQLKFKSEFIKTDSEEFKRRLEIFLAFLNHPPVAAEATQAAVTKPTVNFPASPLFNSGQNMISADSNQRILNQPTFFGAASPAPQPTQKPPQPTQPVAQPEPIKKDQPLPSSEELKKTVELAKEAQTIQTKIIETEQQLNQIKAEAAKPGANPKQYISQFESLINNLQQLNQQASNISRQLAIYSKTTQPSQVISSAATSQPTPQIKTAPKIAPSLVLTSTPNIINGIITDTNGNYLEEAIIVTHDKQGLPVRALKTNKLGQFIAATPLPNSTYTINVEKDGLLFDVVEVELKGEILKPVIISAKKMGVSV
ncbi:PrgI family protein [Candidatus Daviesbacteria bacterium]|nr:PrgI family protein [Candidatus Daviesbacteria bacterium]